MMLSESRPKSREFSRFAVLKPISFAHSKSDSEDKYIKSEVPFKTPRSVVGITKNIKDGESDKREILCQIILNIFLKENQKYSEPNQLWNEPKLTHSEFSF